jgi:MFS family permease
LSGFSTWLGPLGEREFRLLFVGQLISFTGTAMAPVALAFAVLDFGSASDLGLVLAASFAPQIAFVLVGGVWADRLPRNVVIVGSNIVSGAAQGAIAFLLLLDRAELWHLIVLQIVRGIATSFEVPAVTGVVPHTVPPSQLQQANALMRLSQNSTNVAGAFVGGVLVAAIGSGWAIALDAASYLASAVVLAGMRVSARAEQADRRFLRELTEGWREFRSRTWLWSLVLAAAVCNLTWMGGIAVLGPLVARQSLGGPAAWGGVLAGVGAGLLASSLLALRWRPRRPVLTGLLVLGGVPLFLASLAVPEPLPAVIAASIAAGFGLGTFNVNWLTTIHEQIPDAVLSRVASYDALGSLVIIPLGLIVAGPAGDAFGIPGALWAASGIGSAAVLGALLVRDVRELRPTRATIRLT